MAGNVNFIVSLSIITVLLLASSGSTFSEAVSPNLDDGYFDYDLSGSYGPRKWKNIEKIKDGDQGYYWHSFNLEDGFNVTNECGSSTKQSPIDVCAEPSDTCTETHEMRPKPGDYEMNSDLIAKQILPNKLRLLMARRTGDEPDPPQIDFSSTGQGIIDMTNIDFKFPSEHTVCGKVYDGEMQYFVYNSQRKRFLAVSFLLDASETNPKNEHLQEVIDAFMLVYKEDRRKCRRRQRESTSNTAASSFVSSGGRMLHKGDDIDGRNFGAPLNTTIIESKREGGLRSHRRQLASPWHPFHPDIQRSIHFWGYSGSITEPPCTKFVDWKIMDVPTPISLTQLAQFKLMLYTHVDEFCHRTSVHDSKGGVARPTQDPLKYYKCTRENYVSDEESTICGENGCDTPFGAGLNRYYPPLVDVTGPPTLSPSN